MEGLTNNSLDVLYKFMNVHTARRFAMTSKRMRELYQLCYDFSRAPMWCKRTCEAYALHASRHDIACLLENPHHFKSVRYIVIADLTYYRRQRDALHFLRPLDAIGALHTPHGQQWANDIAKYACCTYAGRVLTYLLDCGATTPHHFHDRLLRHAWHSGRVMRLLLAHPSCHVLTDRRMIYFMKRCDPSALRVLLHSHKVAFTSRADNVKAALRARLEKALHPGRVMLLKVIIESELIPWETIQFRPALKQYQVILDRSRVIRVIDYLVHHPRWDPSTFGQYAWRWACARGDVALVKTYLQDSRVDPTQHHQIGFLLACKYGRAGVVACLLNDPRLDPTRATPPQNTNYLNIAIAQNHPNVVEILLQDRRVQPHRYRRALFCLAHNFLRPEKHARANTLLRILYKDTRFNPFHLNECYHLFLSPENKDGDDDDSSNTMSSSSSMSISDSDATSEEDSWDTSTSSENDV